MVASPVRVHHDTQGKAFLLRILQYSCPVKSIVNYPIQTHIFATTAITQYAHSLSLGRLWLLQNNLSDWFSWIN